MPLDWDGHTPLCALRLAPESMGGEGRGACSLEGWPPAPHIRLEHGSGKARWGDAAKIATIVGRWQVVDVERAKFGNWPRLRGGGNRPPPTDRCAWGSRRARLPASRRSWHSLPSNWGSSSNGTENLGKDGIQGFGPSSRTQTPESMRSWCGPERSDNTAASIVLEARRWGSAPKP